MNIYITLVITFSAIIVFSAVDFKEALKLFYPRMIQAKYYIDGFYAGLLRVLSACFILNCFLFNADGTVLHVGRVKGMPQSMPSVVAEAHAEENRPALDEQPTHCAQSLGLKEWKICRGAELGIKLK